MRSSRLGIFALAAVLALAGCATSGPSVPPGGSVDPPPIVSTGGTVVDEQAMFALEAAYNVTATAYLAAVDSGMIRSGADAPVRRVMIQGYRALQLARAAYRVGDAATFAAQAAAATEALERATALIPK